MRTQLMTTCALCIVALGAERGLAIVPAADPHMALEAPRECLAYFSTSGLTRPDPNSSNETEKLLAEPEVLRLIEQLDQALTKASATPQPGQPPIVKHLPELLRTLVTRPLAIHVTKFQPRPGGPPAFEAAMIVNLGERAAAIKAALDDVQRMLPPSALATIPAGAKTFYKFELPGQPAVAWTVDGAMLRVAVGENAVERLQSTRHDRPPAWLATVHRQLPVPRVASTLYVNVAAIVRIAASAMPPEVQAALARLELGQVQYYAAVSGLDERGYVSKSLAAAPGSPQGLFGVGPAKPLTAADLALIPAETPLAIAARFDADAALAAVTGIIAQTNQPLAEKITGELGVFHRNTGIDLRKDVLQALGDVWTVHVGPGGGMLIFPGVTATVSLRDPQRFAATHEKMLALANAVIARSFAGSSPQRPPSIRKLTVAGRTVHYVNDIAPGFPLAPAWCLTDTHLIVGLYPQSVSSVLLRPKSAGTLAAQPQVAELLQEKNPVLALTYHDAPRLWEQFYPILQLGMQSGLSVARQQGPIPEIGLDLDVSLLPSSDAISRHLRPGVSAWQSSPEGIRTVARGTLPGGGPLDPTTVGLAMAMVFPAFSQTMDTVRQNQSAANMRSLLTAMSAYRTANAGRFPKPYTVDKAGKPLLSWRVQLLPYLDERLLYDQFRHTEPWDSPHNRALIPRMPKVFRSPRTQAEPGKTTYLAVRGKDAVFIDANRQRNSIMDGESRTAILVEVNDEHAVEWTRPDDFDIDNVTPLSKPFQRLGRRTNFGFADGHIEAVSPQLDENVLKALFTANGRESIPDTLD